MPGLHQEADDLYWITGTALSAPLVTQESVVKRSTPQSVQSSHVCPGSEEVGLQVKTLVSIILPGVDRCVEWCHLVVISQVKEIWSVGQYELDNLQVGP